MRPLTRVLALSTIVVAAVLFGSGAASAQDDGTTAGDAYVGGVTTIPTNPVNPEVANPEVKGASAVSPLVSPEVKGSTLAFTGGDVLALVAIGAVAVGSGAMIVVTRRRNALAA